MLNLLVTRALGGVAAFFEPRDTTVTGHVAWERTILIGIVLLGAFLRFWGLGDIGLHREDEDTTGLAAIHILEDGVPRYPSGMPYGRAIVQSYLIGGSLYLFGNSEWALRLPSALCGVLLIVLAYFMGRRFLSPLWNVVFAGIVAFLPGLILMSQTARMYIFLLACLAGYSTLIFAWERTGRITRLVAAVLVLILALQFQTLSLFAIPLLFFPALLHADARKFWLACAASIVVIVAYRGIDLWVASLYIEPEVLGAIGGGQPTQADRVSTPPLGFVALAAAGAAGLVLFLIQRIGSGWLRWIAAGMMLGGFASQLLLHYHLAALLFAAAAVIALRENQRALPALSVILFGVIVLAVMQALMLRAGGIPSFRNIVGVMAGFPSVLAYANLGDYSAAAVALCGAGVVAALWQVAHRRKVPDVWLMFLLAAWVPLLVVGVFLWNPATRYTAVAALPALLTAVAVLERLTTYLSTRTVNGVPGLPAVVAAVIGIVLIVNPIKLGQAVHSGYDIHPDHKGAAEYIKSLRLGPDAILMAEDVIVQRYYLDRVDYWLMAEGQAAYFSRRIDGVLVDTYTDTRIMGSAEQLAAVIEKPDRGDIYIIGSGENQENGRAGMRGAGMHRILTSGIFPVVYHGRDGLTKVWKIPPLPPGRRLADLLADPEAARQSLGAAQPLRGESQ